jgi:hypothetical protein
MKCSRPGLTFSVFLFLPITIDDFWIQLPPAPPDYYPQGRSFTIEGYYKSLDEQTSLWLVADALGQGMFQLVWGDETRPFISDGRAYPVTVQPNSTIHFSISGTYLEAGPIFMYESNRERLVRSTDLCCEEFEPDAETPTEPTRSETEPTRSRSETESSKRESLKWEMPQRTAEYATQWSIRLPETDEKNSIDLGSILGIITTGLITAIVSGGIIYCCLCRKNEEVGNEKSGDDTTT